MQLVARRYDTREVVCVQTSQGLVQSLAAPRETPPMGNLPWLAPGFVDLQVNGYGGREFNHPELTVDDVARITAVMPRHGLTSYYPTLTTHSCAALTHGLRTLARTCEVDAAVAALIAGIHLEGPYISPDDGPRGAHPRQHVHPPDWDEFRRLQEAAAGRIRILTLSPEYPQAAKFIARVAATGVLVAIGHTSASSDQIRAAVDAGARLTTHLGNGAHGQIRRHPNYIWDQLAEDRLTASLIADGQHLPPSVVKSFLRAKTSQRCVLISDLSGLAGLPPGRHENTALGAVEILDSGPLVVAGQRQLLAGAALPITVGIANVMRFAEAELRTAVDLASLHPARLLGLPFGRLAVGAPADLVLFRLPVRAAAAGLEVVATTKAGQVIFGEVASFAA